MTSYAKHFSTLSTPQTEKADSRQVLNSAGGFVFQLTPQKQLERFLILGCDGGSYYATEKKLTVDNAQVVIACLNADPVGTVETIAQMSESGRAPKNDPAIFALAIAAGHKSDLARAAALRALPRVCRIGTHLFQFAEAVQYMRGWGKGLKRAVSNWYNEKSVKDVMYQVAKYGQRNGWTHKDLFRLAHPVTESNGDRAMLYRYIASGDLIQGKRLVKAKKAGTFHQEGADREYEVYGQLPAYLQAFEQLKVTRDPKEALFLIREWKFTHEMVPSEVKNSPEVWEALAEHMLPTAMIRNLAKMTAVGLIQPLGKQTLAIAEKLTNQDSLRKAKVHPIALLSALRVYAQGHGEKGKLTWVPNQRIVDALNEAFYLSFGTIEPTNKATMLALDVSGSMGGGEIAGIPGMTPRDVSAAFSMVTARTEKNYHIAGFSRGMSELKISPTMRLDDVISVISGLPFDTTDCSLPMRWATQHNVGVEVFHVYTDNETYAGNIHPHQALVAHRKATGIPAKLAVLGMIASPFTIADPSDPFMLDVCGVDSAVPNILSDFARQ
jgi:60 kDa SS-A/Ro ribonucleoprotein